MAKAKHTLSLDAQGDLFYKRCGACGQHKSISEFTLNGTRLYSKCKPCTSAATRAYALKNTDAVKRTQAEHYQKNKQLYLERSKANRLANPERAKQYRESWYRKNREIASERSRIWADANREKKLQSQRLYYKNSKGLGRHRAWVAKRRAAKIMATPVWADQGKIAEYYSAADFLSMVTGEWYNVDHIVPLQSELVCGLHWEGNMQILTRRENYKKSNRWWPDMPAMDEFEYPEWDGDAPREAG